jgi:two-component system response regulator HupR/HoxA
MAEARSCILIVDDEPLNRELLRRVLAREYEVEEAEDGPQALEILERRADSVGLVLCDQLMPGMSGTELATKARDRWPDLVFVLLTGYDDDEDVTAARDSGLVAHVVSKPWRGAALKSLIEESIRAT